MKRSLHSSAPVITLLSSSLNASRRSKEILCSLFGLEPISFDLDGSDELNRPTRSLLPRRSQEWDSLACRCSSSGTVIHLLSPGMSSIFPTTKRDTFSLLAITGEKKTSSIGNISIARSILASQMEQRKWKVSISQALGRSLRGNFGGENSLPFLDLPTIDDDHLIKPAASAIALKEVAVPFYMESVYPNGTTLQATLSNSSLMRPSVGLYQWPSSSLVIRPLPAAMNDRQLAPASLIFQCESLDQALTDMEKAGVSSVKIGFAGTGKGQLVVRHQDLLPGMEVRFCENVSYSSAFAEAQESLLAGSLNGLQNRNVLLEGGLKGVEDHRVGLGDCWMEVRAMLLNPSGFWKRHRHVNSNNKPQVAKAPELPYE